MLWKLGNRWRQNTLDLGTTNWGKGQILHLAPGSARRCSSPLSNPGRRVQSPDVRLEKKKVNKESRQFSNERSLRVGCVTKAQKALRCLRSSFICKMKLWFLPTMPVWKLPSRRLPRSPRQTAVLETLGKRALLSCSWGSGHSAQGQRLR